MKKQVKVGYAVKNDTTGEVHYCANGCEARLMAERLSIHTRYVWHVVIFTY